MRSAPHLNAKSYIQQPGLRVEEDSTRREAIHPDRPFFLTGVHGSGRVRILGYDGEVLRSWTGDELSFAVGFERWSHGIT